MTIQLALACLAIGLLVGAVGIGGILLPSALTWIFSSLRTSVGFALIGAVVGEYLGSHEGMGYVISYAESMFNATGVLSGLIVLMLAVTLIDLGLKKLDTRFSYWKPSSRGA